MLLKNQIKKIVFRSGLLVISATSALAGGYIPTDAAPPLSSTPPIAITAAATPVIRAPQFGDSINRYVGLGQAELISLNFTNVKVRELLQIIAQFTKLNFIINDNVGGEMSIHLHDVPWTQALDVILKSQNLGERHVGNVVYIAPMAELIRQEVAELEARQHMKDLAPIDDRVIRLSYANAEDIQNLLKTKDATLLSLRGSISIDKRTNSVWIRDTAAHILTIVKMIHQLDRPVKQVMIEARIVEVDRKFERQLGSRFGLSKSPNLSGTLEGANELVQAGGNASQVPLGDRLNFNNPAAGGIFGGSAIPGSIALAVAKLGSTFIDMELSALEEQNDLDIISSPRLITSNQEKAYIETGQQIPYESSTSSGATAVSFANALLKLEVTPQITPDNRVVLNLLISNNSAGTPVALLGGGQAIPINTQEEGSRVLLNNNQTVVLGGVYQRQKTTVIDRIPYISRIPILGHLFKSTDKSRKDLELLIFLTPHIIQKPSDISSTY